MASFLHPASVTSQSMTLMCYIMGGSSTLAQTSTAARGLSAISFDPSWMIFYPSIFVEYLRNDTTFASTSESFAYVWFEIKLDKSNSTLLCRSADILVAIIHSPKTIQGKNYLTLLEELKDMTASLLASADSSCNYLELISLWQISTLKHCKK